MWNFVNSSYISKFVKWKDRVEIISYLAKGEASKNLCNFNHAYYNLIILQNFGLWPYLINGHKRSQFNLVEITRNLQYLINVAPR